MNNLQNNRITNFSNDVLEICPTLLGKYLCRRFEDGIIIRKPIIEVEAYRGIDDLACHASKGRTKRTEIMFANGGYVYVYLIYGMYWMLNIVTGPIELPQAILIRGVEGCIGPGRVGRLLAIDASFYGENLIKSNRIWIEESKSTFPFIQTERVGVGYAGPEWAKKPWRFVAKGF